MYVNLRAYLFVFILIGYVFIPRYYYLQACCSVSVIKLYFSLSFVYYGFVPDRLARLKSWKAKKLLLVLKKKIE